MGAKKARLSAFLAKHPFCCFCGGSAAATTQDHIPPRGIFAEKKWPEGYVFPGCTSCNNGSARDDALVAFLSRMNVDAADGTVEAMEWNKLLTSIREHYPGLAREMILSANEVRRWMRKHGVAKPFGLTYGEVPMIRIPEVIVAAVRRFNNKLLRALHYKHTGMIIPSTAWTHLQWWTNANLLAREFPREIAEMMPGRAALKRGKVLLGNQFGYSFGTGNDGTLGAYLATFRKSFVVVGVVVFDAALMVDIDEKAVDSTVQHVVEARVEVDLAPVTNSDT